MGKRIMDVKSVFGSLMGIETDKWADAHVSMPIYVYVYKLLKKSMEYHFLRKK